MAKEQEDLREEILERYRDDSMFPGMRDVCYTEFQAKLAMDDYMKERILEAFSFLAKHSVDCEVTKDGKELFLYKGEMITREQLFENFL